MATYFQVNCGGSAASPYEADAYYTGGGTTSTGDSINTSGVTSPAPEAVYQTERWSPGWDPVTYTLTGLSASTTYKIRFHFAEIFHTSNGSRVFDVLVNSTEKISNLDIHAVVGHDVAHIVEVEHATNGSGQYVITCNNDTDAGKFSGIEVEDVAGGAPTPKGKWFWAAAAGTGLWVSLPPGAGVLFS